MSRMGMTGNQGAGWRKALGAMCAIPVLTGTLLAGDPIPERVWSDYLTNESYYNHTVSIGNHGTQVFCDTGYLGQKTRLYSSFDDFGVAAWERSENHTALNRFVDSSEDGDIHAVWRQDLIPNTSNPQARAYVYRSSSPSPIAVHEFDSSDYGPGNGSCAVSDDGRWVVTTTGKLNTIHVARIDTTSSNPNHPETEIAVSRLGPTHQYGLSSDGSRLYLGGPMSGTVIDLNTGATLFDSQYFFGSGTRAHAFSGDGKTILVPRGNIMRVYRESGGAFTEIAEFDPFPNTTDEAEWAAAISHDGDLISVAYSVLPDFQDSHVLAWRVSTGQQLLHHTLSGIGVDDNIPRTLVMSRDGERIALGSYGDEGGLTPEIVVFEKPAFGGSYQVHSTFNQPGSVFDMALSSDGDHLAISGRTSHANDTLGSKVIEVFNLGADFRAHGRPRSGHAMQFEIFGSPGTSHGIVLFSDQLQTSFYPFGTLFLNRQGIDSEFLATANADGTVSGYLTLSGAVGSTMYYQGFASGPRALTDTWLPITILPQ